MKSLNITTFSYLLINLLVISASTIISILLSFLLGYLIFRIANPQFYADAESGLSIFGFGLLVLVILLPVSLLVAYFISMKLAIYLREKHNWTITHPRWLFVVSLFIPLPLIFLPKVFLK